MSKPIVYVDMDGVLCDYMRSHRAIKAKSPLIVFPQMVYGMFRDLEPMEGAIESYRWLHENFETYILTRPSVKNPSCYTEKREWVEKHLGLEICENLILNPHKGLMRGDYLIDDMPWPQFKGQQITFGSKEFPSWREVIAFFEEKTSLAGSVTERIRSLLVEMFPMIASDLRAEVNNNWMKFSRDNDAHNQLELLKALRILIGDAEPKEVGKFDALAMEWTDKNRHRMEVQLELVTEMIVDGDDDRLLTASGNRVSTRASDIFQLADQGSEEDVYMRMRGGRCVEKVGRAEITSDRALFIELGADGKPRVWYGRTGVVMSA